MKNSFSTTLGSEELGCIKMICANLSSDTFFLVCEDAENESGLHRQCDSLSQYFSEFADGGYVHPEDLTDFRVYTSLDYLRSYFRENHGKELFWLHYRRKVNGEYRWAVMEIQPAQDYSENCTAVNIVVRDIRATMCEQSTAIGSVLRALCQRYDSVYSLNVEDGSLTTFRTFSHNVPTFDAFMHSNPTYQDLITRYIHKSVLPEDRSHVARITTIDFIRECLSSRDYYSGEFRTVYDGEAHWYRIIFARIESDGKLRDVAIGLTDISDEKRMESDFYRNGRMVLIASPDRAESAELIRILGSGVSVVTADSGKETLRFLKSGHENVAVVIADAVLPDMTGCQLLEQIRAEHGFRSIPVMIAAADGESAEEYIEAGASDVLERPYQERVVKNRVDFMLRYREASNMLNILERDPLTGLYSKEFFFRFAEKRMHDKQEEQYAVLISDVERFHFYKERYGQTAANDLLKNMAILGPKVLRGFLAGGRIAEDVFAYLVRYSTEISEDVRAMQRCFAQIDTESSISVKYGLYVVDEDIPVSAMCDRAVLAVKSIKGVYGRDLAGFDDELREHLLQTQQIVENAEEGLDQEQFVVYYQPKHNVITNGIDGAEAVIRWIHPKMGFMNPMSFIPLFEKNGFIEVLDQFVLNSVCRDLAVWTAAGEPTVPISVNISRVDFSHPGLAQRIMEIVDSYHLDHSLIHIEITESGYSDSPERITREVQLLHNAGFLIELDDFGTGYSSLSALSALPVDILKLDMSLLARNEEANSRNILEFSMKLAKILNMETVQEGVETVEQLNHVAALGCDHAQGFYFSRPLPKQKFIEYCRKCVNSQ